MPPFTFTITADQLSRGLRPSKRAPRDAKFLVESKGALGRNGVLAAIDDLVRFDTSVIEEQFPYPQLFITTNFIIVCGETSIYEYDVSTRTLALKFTASLAGIPWTLIDFYNYIYLSNGKVAIVKDPDTGVYSETDDVPTTVSGCNFNGQVILGSPDTPLWLEFSKKVRGLMELDTSFEGLFFEDTQRNQILKSDLKPVKHSSEPQYMWTNGCHYMRAPISRMVR